MENWGKKLDYKIFQVSPVLTIHGLRCLKIVGMSLKRFLEFVSRVFFSNSAMLHLD